MKTNLLSRLAFTVSLLFAMATGASTLKAQCANTTIQNQTPCSIVVNYTYTCNIGNICSSGSGVTIGPNSNFQVLGNCGCSTGICRLSVTLQKVAGTVVGPVTVSSTMTSNTYVVPASCPSASGNMTWVSNIVTIN